MPPFFKSFGLGLLVNTIIIFITVFSREAGQGRAGVWFYLLLLGVAFIIFLLISRQRKSDTKAHIPILLGVLLAIPSAVYLAIIIAPFFDLLLGQNP